MALSFVGMWKPLPNAQQDHKDCFNFYPARALRALGLLLVDGAPTVSGEGETAVSPEQKVEKSIPRWEINHHAEG